MKKDRKWEWAEKEERAFGELKRMFTKELVLAAPDLDKTDRGRCFGLCNGGSIVDGV